MPLFLHFFFFSTIHYLTHHIFHMMRLALFERTGGLYIIVHTTCSSCDEAWIDWLFLCVDPVVFKVTVSSGNFMAFLPNWGSNLRPKHQRL
jgi:hypothetical protein